MYPSRKPKNSEEPKRHAEPSETKLTHNTTDIINCHFTEESFATGDFVLVEYMCNNNTKKEIRKK